MKAKKSPHAKRIILKEGKFMRLVKKGKWEFAERNNCSGIVIIVAMTNEKKVIFVEQYRPPVDKRVIEFPAGLVNDECYPKIESFATAAKRELLEETGYQAQKIIELLKGPASSGSSADVVTMVHAKGLKKVAAGGGNKFESIVVHEVDFKKVDVWLKTMEAKGYLVEPKIYTGLYFLKNYNNGH